MYDWKNFHGCRKLSIKDNIDFLYYLENDDRIYTDEGKFLHYQYLRELLSRQELIFGGLDCERGSFQYYTIDRLKLEIEKIKKTRNLGWMLIPTYECYIETIKNMYLEEWYNICIITDASIVETFPIDISDGIEDNMDIFVRNHFNLLLMNSPITHMTSDEIFIEKSDKIELIPFKRLFAGWYNDKYKIDNIYLYQMKVNSIAMNFEWTGYCENDKKWHKGISKIKEMEWLNI